MGMNRQMRRKQQKEKPNPAAVEKQYGEHVRSLIDFTVQRYSAAMILCLHDKLGFGPKRCAKFLDNVTELFSAINQGYLTLDDILQTIEEEVGIIIERGGTTDDGQHGKK